MTRPTAISPHTCHATGCAAVVPRRMFMCKRHWFMLTLPMRDEVWSVYQEGQEEGRAPVSAEYLEVTTRIIHWLAVKEGILSE